MSVITKKGQVTIPKHMRDSLHIKEGDSVTFELREGEIAIRKLDRISILGLGGMLRGSSKKGRPK
jgi:AbrB family looped-hinge helix DNA binding protein